MKTQTRPNVKSSSKLFNTVIHYSPCSDSAKNAEAGLELWQTSLRDEHDAISTVKQSSYSLNSFLMYFTNKSIRYSCYTCCTPLSDTGTCPNLLESHRALS